MSKQEFEGVSPGSLKLSTLNVGVTRWSLARVDVSL
jgi:hypothetical protein